MCSWLLISSPRNCNDVLLTGSKPSEAARKAHNYYYLHIVTNYLLIVINNYAALLAQALVVNCESKDEISNYMQMISN